MKKELYDLKTHIADLKLKIKSSSYLKNKIDLEKELEILRKKHKKIVAKNRRERNREKILEYHKRWREKNREKVLEKNKKWREKNREYPQKYYEKNKEKNYENHKKYYEKNKEKIKKYYREYKKKRYLSKK